MYIKLGTINLRYYQETNDWMILGEILESGMSYEKPILVRTTDELNIWFGKDYKDYHYMQELINMGVVLYLYKPTYEITSGGEDYIDLDKYVVEEDVWLRDVELEWIGKVVESPEKYKFKYNERETIKEIGFVINSDGLSITENVDGRRYCTEETVREELISPVNQISKIYSSPIRFHVFNSADLWIYKDGEIVDTELLPQNLNLTSVSKNNRDTLIISSPEDIIDYTYLDYNYVDDTLGIFNNKYLIEHLEDAEHLEDIDMDLVSTGFQTLMFRILSDSTLGDDDYFVIPNTSRGINTEGWILFYRGNYEEIPKDIKDLFPIEKSVKITTFQEFIGKLRNDMGYRIIENEEDHDYYIYSKTIIPVTHFYRSKHVEIIAETKITEAVLSRYITTGIEVISKTIGRSSDFEDDLIKFVVGKTDNDQYRITISRYSYSEVYEGTLEYTRGKQRLDNQISLESKLVKCNFYGEELREGVYYLRGAEKEKSTPEMYRYSLKQMLDTEYNIPAYPDYFMIPDKYKYTSDIIEDSPYQLFLDFSKEVNCQFLIENKPYFELFNIETVENLPDERPYGTYYKIEGENIYYDWNGNIVIDPFFNEVVSWGGDFVFNYIKDEENRLVYFYKGMKYLYDDRPGYYAYLRGVLLNEFSISVKDIYYSTPTEDAFLDYDIETLLKKYKSNYLVCDNQTYFYKEYQDGKTYQTTGWTRFIAGKVFRELQKNSGEILGQQMLGIIRAKISGLINSISKGFSIVSTIGITNFEPEDNGQSLRVDLDTVMNDQVKNHVNLDITVNYNNNVYGTIS